MSGRELVVLGTASQAPTRARSQTALLLRWDDEAILFDPGEGAQRQMLLAGESPSRLTRVCIGHFHGDHCLGLSGVVQRRRLDGAAAPLRLHYPVWGEPYVHHLLASCAIDTDLHLVHEQVGEGLGAAQDTVTASGFELTARALDHTVPTVGWRLEVPPARHLLPDALAAAGVTGALVAELEQRGRVVVDGRSVVLEEVSELRRGPVFAVVLDTRRCGGAEELADGADLLVCEATYLESEADLARAHGHLTAAGAARLARDCGARRLVLMHYSERYPDERLFAEEAAAVFPDVVAAIDLTRVPFPSRAERIRRS